MDVLFIITLTMQGGGWPPNYGSWDVCIHGETPPRLDNIGKKCRVPFVYTL